MIVICYTHKVLICRSGGMADATDSKSVVGNNVRVQVPPSAPIKITVLYAQFFLLIAYDIPPLLYGVPKKFIHFLGERKNRANWRYNLHLCKFKHWASVLTQWQTHKTQNPLLATTCTFYVPPSAPIKITVLHAQFFN